MDSSTSSFTNDLTQTNSFSTSSDNMDLTNNNLVNCNWTQIILWIILMVFIYYIISNYFVSCNLKQENMSGGTVNQLLSQDLQDINLTGGPYGITDNLATGNFQMHWNQPTRTGGNRANWSPIPIRESKTKQEMDELNFVNPSNLKLDNTPFPRINPKSTVSSYPGIKNILINQKNNEDYIQTQLENQNLINKQMDTYENNMRLQSLNNLQSSLINSCKNCNSSNCANCSACPNNFDAKSIANLDNNSRENFDSGLNSVNNFPLKIHNQLTKKLLKENNTKKNFSLFDDVKENFNNIIDLNNPLRENTGTCANCPQARCINCPKSIAKCDNCALGYPCATCKTYDFLNNRDQIVDSKENFSCGCKRKIIPPTNLKSKSKSIDNNYKENYTKLIDNNSKNTNQDCLNCLKQCPCSFGNCLNCPNCMNKNCSSCPKSRCGCLMGRCQDCPLCKLNKCEMCMQNIANINKQSNNNQNESFDTVGFDKLCPCSAGKCTNCSECRMGKCNMCSRSKNSDFIDLAAFGTGHGGYRLGTNWNDATTGPSPVMINDTVVYYPDSYVGSYFINPKPDIAYPYAVIPPSRTVSGLVAE